MIAFGAVLPGTRGSRFGAFCLGASRTPFFPLPHPQTPSLGEGAPPQKRRCGPAGPVASLRITSEHQNSLPGARTAQIVPFEHKLRHSCARDLDCLINLTPQSTVLALFACCGDGGQIGKLRQILYLYTDKSKLVELIPLKKESDKFQFIGQTCR